MYLCISKPTKTKKETNTKMIQEVKPYRSEKKRNRKTQKTIYFINHKFH